MTAFQLNDLVFGFTWRSSDEKAHQEFVLAPQNLLAKVPEGWEHRLHEVVTLPNNFVTAWHTLVTDLGLTLPWPKTDEALPEKEERILVWGGSSSVGQFALQILRYYGYGNVVATASRRNSELCKESGAKAVVDYNSANFASEIRDALGGDVDLVSCITWLEVFVLTRFTQGTRLHWQLGR